MLGGGEGSSPSVSATHNLFFDRSLFKTLLMADLCIIAKKGEMRASYTKS